MRRIQSPGRRLAGILVLAVSLAVSGCRPETPVEPPASGVELSPNDRILILAPHPDDEVIGCGGIIQRAVAMGLPLRIVFFTYGDNNEWSFLLYRKRPVLAPRSVMGMGLIRHDEAVAAAKVLGVTPSQLTFLGYPDFGTMSIWKEHWNSQPPYQSLLTRATAVPYANALRPGAPYKGEEILRDLTGILREFRPTKVFVSHPGDQMSDHLALYLFTKVALWNLESEIKPDVYPYLVHFRQWPKPRGYRPSEPLTPPRLFQGQGTWRSHWLSPNELERKRAAINAHRTQYAYSARYLLSFMRPNELFGDFLVVPLRAAPTPDMLLLEGHQTPVEVEEELTDQERAAFVGFEERSVRLAGNDLILSMVFSRPLAEAVEASVSIFGYRPDTSFAQMPKLTVKFGALGYELYDQDKKLPRELLHVDREPKRLTLRIPLETLGTPDRIFTSARTYLGEVPLDVISWRILDLSPDD